MSNYRASQLWGRTWDGGDITLSYEWYDDSPVRRPASSWSLNYTPWGLDNRIPLASSIPGTISLDSATASNPKLSSVANLGTNCSNCFAIPAGTGVSFTGGATGLGPGVNGSPAAPTLRWNGTTFVALTGPGSGASGAFGTGGTANEFDPYNIAYYSAAERRNGATLTVDQRLAQGVTFAGEAFYSNRRALFLNPSNLSPSSGNDLTVQVPTFNPYYPIGTGVPQNINVNVNMGIESPSVTAGFEISSRYEG